MTKVYLDLKEIDELEESAQYLRDKLLIRLLSRLGCRVSEALAIRVKDIDFKQRRITILHLKSRLKLSCPECATGLSKHHKFCPGCGISVQIPMSQALEMKRQRVLPIDRQTLDMLHEYIRRDGTKDLIFRITRTRAYHIIRDCAERAGLGEIINPETGKRHRVSPHKLRDAFAVHAVRINDSGDGLRLLQEHLGHQSITTTMKYRKISGEEAQEWYNKLWQDKDGNSA